MNYRSKSNQNKIVRVMGEVKIRIAEMRDKVGVLYFDSDKGESFVRYKTEFLSKFEPLKE